MNKESVIHHLGVWEIWDKEERAGLTAKKYTSRGGLRKKLKGAGLNRA